MASESTADSGPGTSSTGGAPGSSGTNQGSTTGELSTSTTGGDGSTTLILDVGADVDVGDGKPAGCKGKIDFLFVISDNTGMKWSQDKLLDAFPKFIETIQEEFSDFDYHIMVVDGWGEWGADYCEVECPAKCVPDYPCDYMPDKCDNTLGTGVVFPAGFDSANKPCPIDGGRRYMVKGQTDLAKTFQCVAQVGTDGGVRVGDALSIAVAPWMNDPGSCHAGFLRDDALLMLTMITNAYDQEGWIDSQEGTPETWMEAVREAKHGDLDSVVALGIIPNDGPVCDKRDRLCQMLKLFPHALHADFLSGDYGLYFDQATDLVEEACAAFIPPG